MPARTVRILAVALAAAGLSGCSLYGLGLQAGTGYYDGGYGYGSGGYYGGGYNDYGYGYGAAPYYGWYNNHYYPGAGSYAYDRYGARRPLTRAERRYWYERLRGYAGERRENWDGFRRDRDRDGIRNRYDATPDGRRGRVRRDTDRDGIRDRVDATPGRGDGRVRRDRNGNGVRDRFERRDRDRDGDGVRNRYDSTPDGRRDRVRRDSDGDGIRDRVDATVRGRFGRSRSDRNGNGVRDGAERRGGRAATPGQGRRPVERAPQVSRQATPRAIERRARARVDRGTGRSRVQPQ